MRRSALLLFTAMLATVTATALTGAALLLAHPAPGVAEIPAPVAPVTAFVAAVNRALQTGDLTTLDTAVSADFVEHGPAAAFGADRAGLGRYLLALRATYPGIQVTLEDTLVSTGRVSVRLMFRGQRIETFLGLALPPTASTWTTVDLFRIEGGKVAEHWAGDTDVDLFLALTGQREELEIDGVAMIAVASMRPSGPVMTPLTLLGAAALVVEGGDLTVRADATWRIVHPNTLVVSDVAAGVDVTLHAGDAAFPRAGSSTIRAVDERSSFMLAATIFASAAAEAQRWERNQAGVDPGDAGLVAALVRPRTKAPVVVGGMLLERLALVYPPPTTSDTVEVALGRAVLRPGGSLRLTGIDGTVAVAVETGHVEVGPNDGRLVIQQPVRPGEEIPPIVIGKPAVLAAGDAVVVPRGAEPELRNTGDLPAVVLVMVVTARDESPPTSVPGLTRVDLSAPTPTAGEEPARGGPS